MKRWKNNEWRAKKRLNRTAAKNKGDDNNNNHVRFDSYTFSSLPLYRSLCIPPLLLLLIFFCLKLCRICRVAFSLYSCTVCVCVHCTSFVSFASNLFSLSSLAISATYMYSCCVSLCLYVCCMRPVNNTVWNAQKHSQCDRAAYTSI